MLLFMDGFDHYSGNVTDTGKWGTQGTWGLTTASLSRTGPRCMEVYYVNNWVTTKPFAPVGGFVLGVAIRVASQWETRDIIAVNEGGTTHLMVGCTSAGYLCVKRAGIVLKTGTLPLPLNSWVYIEFKGVIHDTAGSYELRIDGSLEVSDTNVNTRNGLTGLWDRICLSAPIQQTFSWYDDFYVCDLGGGGRNDFLGPIKIDTFMAQAGSGFWMDFVPSIGGDHGAMVDEIPQNLTDWNASGTVGHKDTYNIGNPILSGDILGVQVNALVSKSDSGVRRISPLIRTNGADYDGPEKALTTGWAYATMIKEKNPNTSLDWTAADLTAIEAGVKVTA